MVKKGSKNSTVQPYRLLSSADLAWLKRHAIELLSERSMGLTGDLLPVVKQFIKRKQAFVTLAKKYPTPFYAFDQRALNGGIKAFKAAFSRAVPGCQIYYALKVNDYPPLVKAVVKAGLGVDASSTRELMIGFDAGARRLVLTGPAKTQADLTLATKQADKVIINLDSFAELERLIPIAKRGRRPIRLGVRVFTPQYADWNKFGIPLSELKNFWRKAQGHANLKLEGIHVHMSWNRDAGSYEQVIRQLATYLKNNFTIAERQQITFIDLGGGFRPYRSEGFYHWGTSHGKVARTVAEHYNRQLKFNPPYFLVDSVPIEQYAVGIGQAIKKHLAPLGRFTYLFEPGKIICNNAMHLVMRIADVKTNKVVIADAGNNMIGWERFEYEYFPLINLTHPSTKETAGVVYDNLCMPNDIWGYSCFASNMAIGDVLMIPYQGALTYSLRQSFIRGEPTVRLLP